MPIPNQLTDMVSSFAGLNVVVIGEAMLDSYLMGSTNRLCREAPVPVVDLSDRQQIPGGAANTAVNLRSLGAQVSFLSVIGDDLEGDWLRQALTQRGVCTDRLLTQPGRQTLVKYRVMSDSQLLLRLDQGSIDMIAPAVESVLVQHLQDLFSQADAIVLSDYGYGILTPNVIHSLTQLQQHSLRLLIADSKRLEVYRSVGVAVVKPNYEEAARLLGLTSLGSFVDRAEQMAFYRHSLLDLTGAKSVVVTLDSEGALLLQPDFTAHTGAKVTASPCTIGAGDTFVSSLTLALAAGAATTLAIEVATEAAAIVVAKAGTATCSARELQAALVNSSLGQRGLLFRTEIRTESESRSIQEVA